MGTRRTFGKGLLASAVPAARTGWGTDARAYTGAASLRAHAAAAELRAGMAVNARRLGSDAAYTRTVAEQCNVVVAENAMKWAALRPAPGKFDFAEADRFVNWAEGHGMAIRGHNLCWHEALPGWFAGSVNKSNAEQILREHIRTVVGRYRGKIRAWDVVNEAVDPKDGRSDGLRASPWLELLGPRYLDIAFQTAGEADPQALLTYNDYGLETADAPATAKRAAVLGLLRRLKQSGSPVDALGVQSHLSAGSSASIGSGPATFVEHTAGLGLKVFITELDVNDDAIEDQDSAVRANKVAAIYGQYLRLMLANPAVKDVLCWGVENRASWLNAPANAKFRPRHPEREEICLPFDDNFRPEPAFYTMRDVMDGRKR